MQGLVTAGKWYLILKIAEKLVNIVLTIFLISVIYNFLTLTLAQVGAIFGLH